MSWVDWITDSSGFMPRTLCGPAWTPALVAVHRACDLVIFVSFLLICVGLFNVARKNLSATSFVGAILYSLVFVSCAVSHFTNQLMFVEPMYRLDGAAKVLAALAGLVAVVWTFHPSSWRPRA